MPLNFTELNNNTGKTEEENRFNDIHTRYMNGRILPSNKPITPFELFQGERRENTNSYDGTTLENALETTTVSKLFFSNRNKDYLHKKIIDEVFVKSDNRHTITRQSDLHLLIIMRSIYLQYGMNAFCDVEEQVKKLDELVVKECVSRILVELEQRLKYNDFVSKTPEQIPLPKNPSIKGDKILYSKIG